MRRRYSDEEVEAAMIPQIVDAIYPVLIPMEQQDYRIQAQNQALMTKLATALWRSFRSPYIQKYAMETYAGSRHTRPDLIRGPECDGAATDATDPD